MAYDKNIWVDQSVERPRTYEMTNNADGSVTLIDSFGLVSELGTPVNADNMNHIEDGIEFVDLAIGNLNNLATNDKANLVVAINELQENSSGNESKLEAQKAYLTGNILTDSLGYSELLNLYNDSTQTGLDIIKPDDYTVVGSPTITEDGIASGFSNSNYITLKTLDLSEPFELYFTETVSSGCSGVFSSDLIVQPNVANNTCYFLVRQNGTRPVRTGVLKFSSNTIINYRISWDGITYKLQYKGNIEPLEWTNVVVFESSEQVDNASNTVFRIGYNANAGVASLGSYDLNNVKFYSDNVLVYQACLKIPYIIAKTGSKIVDSTARERVQDVYNQFGEALYYTIDTTNQNYTIPMGEVYGMIENCRDGKLPVGTIFAHTCSADFVPENSLPTDGTEYTVEQFPNLYNDWLISGKLQTCTYAEFENQITTYGKCAMFGLDTLNKKFKVPLIPDGTVIQQAMTNSEIGKSYNAGLPNITGTFGSNLFMPEQYWTGAFYKDKDIAYNWDIAAGNIVYGTGFSASLSSNIYKNDVTTVQPNAVALRHFIVIATGTINKSIMDWANWASSLQGKANTDLSNCTKPYITEAYNNGASGYNLYSNGYCEQWGTTANVAGGASVTTSFLKQYSSENYNIVFSAIGTYQAIGEATSSITNKTSGSFTITSGRGQTQPYDWTAKGYIS